MKTKLVWHGGMNFSGQGEMSETKVAIGANPAAGGDGTGSSPMELFLMSLAGCASIDIMMILNKRRKSVSDYWVEVTGTRRDEIPKVFTSIHLTFHFRGKDLNEQEVERAIKLSEEKYCSAWNNIDQEKTAITYDYMIHG